MSRLTINLWFDNQAAEAAAFYTSLFSSSKTQETVSYKTETPSNKPVGSVMTAPFELEGIHFIALNGGPHYTPNPSISFIVRSHESEEIERIWQTLIEGGTTLMPLDSYPYSEKFGWVQDKYGFSWQLFLVDTEFTQKIVPKLMMVGDKSSSAEEALEFYISIFDDGTINNIDRYGPDEPHSQEGDISHAEFVISDTELAIMGSAYPHGFDFNEAISFVKSCKDQEEIDYYWNKLSADPQAEQCGWLKDKYGVSWQIVPQNLGTLLQRSDAEGTVAVHKKLLQMKKIDISELERA